MTPIVSIVVPVYNVEKYLNRCIASLREQTLQDIEIILVDDGSTDSSGSLADAFAEKDKRIKVIHKENGGLASARNAGIDAACGEYIAFIDSDDWVDITMFEHLVDCAKKDRSDVVSCGYQYLLNGKVYRVAIPVQPEGRYTGKQIFDLFLLPLIGLDTLYSDEKGSEDFNATSILYRLDLIKKHQLFFQSERVVINEDYLFNLHLLFHVDTLSIMHETPYFYESHNNSLSRSYRQDLWEKRKAVLRSTEEFLKEKGLLDVCRNRLDNSYINGAIEAVSNECSPNHESTLFSTLKAIKTIIKDPILMPLVANCSTKEMSRKGKLVFFFLRHHMALALYCGYSSMRKYEYSSNKNQ